MSEQTEPVIASTPTQLIRVAPLTQAGHAREAAPHSRSPRELVRDALDLLRAPLREFVRSRMEREYGERWAEYALGALHSSHGLERTKREHLETDLSALLTIVGRFWGIAFRRDSVRFARMYFDEVREFRNALAHGESFGLTDALRAIDTVHRLLPIVGETDRSRSGRLRADLMRRVASRVQDRPGREAAAPVRFDVARRPLSSEEEFRSISAPLPVSAPTPSDAGATARA